jgi:Transposase DDE domain
LSNFTPYFVKGFVRKIFPDLRKTQAVNLALGVFGLAKSQSGLLSEIAREIPGATKHKHRLKRLTRFLSNPRLPMIPLQKAYVAWCLKLFRREGKLMVALDWTSLPGNFQVLMIAIPFAGRAIPLLWGTLPFSQIKDSQNKIEERLVSLLLKLLGADTKLTLLADRGFGRASFIKFLKEKKIDFVVRVRADVWIRTDQGKPLLLRKLVLSPEVGKYFGRISYRSDGVVTGINLIAVVARDSSDPWFLITNLTGTRQVISLYRQRFEIEEWFKDLKHQLGIADLQTPHLTRVRRVLFLSALSYVSLILIGKRIRGQMTRLADRLITGGKKVCSIVWLALEAIKHHLLGRSFWRQTYLTLSGP